MATGLPAIATDVGGHAELISGPSEGWLIAPRDTAALVHALRELTGAPSVRLREMGIAARRAAARIASPLDNANRLAAALERSGRSNPLEPRLEKVVSRSTSASVPHANSAH